MNAAAWLGNCLYRGVGTVSGPFHPFGGAVDIIVVEQPDGSFKSSPWYVRFGKFQGVLKNKRNLIKICVNDVEASFSMYLDHTGQAYFLREGDYAEEEEELLVYPSLSSGDEADAKSRNFDEIRIPMKSKSCNYDTITLNSNTGEVVGRRSILGFVFGRKSMKENRLREGTEVVDSGMDRRISIERAEIAADLLETKWSTNLDSRMSFNDKTSQVSGDGEMDSKKKTGEIQEQVPESVDSSLSGDDELSHYILEDKSMVSPEISRNIDEIPSGVSNNGSIWGTMTSSEGSPRLQPVEQQCSDTNKALSQCDGIHAEQVNSIQHCGLYETPESLLLDSDSANGKASTLHHNGEKNGEINMLAESIKMKTSDPLAQDIASVAPSITLESANRVVDIDSKFGSAEEVELGSIGASHDGNSPIHQNQNNNHTDGLDHLIEHMADSQSTCAMSIQHTEGSEEELFLFTDLDESKLREVASMEITYLDAVFKNGKELREQDDTPGEISNDMSNLGSSSIAINRNNEYGGEEDARLVKSLPNLQFHKSDAGHQLPLGRSLESDSRLLNLKYANSLGNLDVEKQNGLVREQIVQGLANGEQFSEEGPNSMVFKHVLANPEIVVEFSLCKHLLHEGMGSEAAFQAFNSEKLDASKFASLAPSIVRNDNLVVRIGGCYFPWEAAASIVLGMAAFGSEKILEPRGMIAVDRVDSYSETASEGKSWKLWPFTVKKSASDEKTVDATKNNVNIDGKENGSKVKFMKKMVKAVSPTSEQLASLNLKDGQNDVSFTFSTKMLGTQQVHARIYLWKWNARIVISDVDGTITKSDVLGQFMPLMGVDWSHLGVTHLFSAIKENGYQFLFLSARAISQASLTRQFLINLKQDGKALPSGPVVISPDGLFPSLFREVIRRAPHEFKIACLEDIRALFPPDNNPFYAGFGNRDTDEFSYLKMGIPRGKIFIINPRGEVAVNRRVDTKSYTSLHELVNGMFPATTNISEQEDYNDVNFWKLPPPVMKF